MESKVMVLEQGALLLPWVHRYNKLPVGRHPKRRKFRSEVPVISPRNMHMPHDREPKSVAVEQTRFLRER
ncbi:hypothetical protein DPMN_094238 [Dreissena polymorpha]|uniref:Uncharacterized protein n=1 Tax=Dreissena polymorpha TaxID=45954 RepID=A0A9D4L4S5_DREPO|nr:hypothetical protein DPMN_094238 [Dreissena polymorpha]